MSYSQTADEARIIVNLDFSLVVPGGTLYQLNEDQLPELPQDIPNGTKLILDLTTPKTVRTGTDFSDPVTRGVVRNYTAGIFIRYYGADVKQETAFSSRNALAIYGLKTTHDGAGYFIVVTERGMYEGRAIIPVRSSKERLRVLKEVLASLTRYDSTRAEIEAVKARKEKEEKEAARRRHLAEEAAAKREEQRLQNEKDEDGRKDREAEQLPEDIQKKEISADSAKAQDSTTKQPTAAEGAESLTKPEPEERSSADMKDRKTTGEAAEETAPAAGDDQKPEPESPTPGTADADRSDSDAAKTAAGEDEGLSEDEKRIRALEEKRKAHLDELRSKFAGNPQVEAGIDNYIARVDHTGDEVVAAFRRFLRGVQDYASSTAFTGEDDPNYVNMRKGVRDEENNLGHKLDDLFRSVDVNVSDAVEAGVTEAYVERMIRMTERLAAKYDKLAVSMNGRDRIAYMVPGEVNSIILKWQKFRENLPSRLEETDRRRELETSNRIQAEIQAKRAELLDRQAAAGEALTQRDASAGEAQARQNEAETFEAAYEEKRARIEQVRDDQLKANHDAVAALQDELEADRQEEEQLREELAHTFALNVNRKKTLTSQISEKETKIADEEERLMQLQDAASGFETEAGRQLSELEAEREEHRNAAAAAEEQKKAAEEAYTAAEEAFRTLKEDLAAQEDEWKHVHENYLAGKYDD